VVISEAASRILVVEDDADQRELLLELLRGVGYACDGAAGVVAAAAALAMHDYTLVLVDFDLRDGTGAELVSLGLVQASRVVYVSGRAAAELPKVAAALRKPLDVSALLRCLEGLVPPVRCGEPTVELVLYVAEGSPASQRAERSLRALLGEGRFGPVRLEVVDVAARPSETLLEDRPWLTPTLVRRTPGPRRWLVGDGLDAVQLAALFGGAEAPLGAEP
jgi:circadian clock protein KaiB